MKCWQLLLTGLLMCLTVSAAVAVDSLTVELPQRTNPKLMPFSTQNALHLECLSIAPKSAGYRPIECTFTALKPKAVDRQITVRLFIRTWNQNNQKIISVEQSGELTASAKQTSLLLRLPQPGNWDYCGLEVFVDGKRDNELCQEYINTNTSFGASGALPELQVLRLKWAPIVATDAEIDELAKNLARGQHNTQIDPSIREYPELTGLSAGEFSDEFFSSELDYTTFDAVVVNSRILESTAKHSPEQLARLLRWVAAGGMLWIEGAGEGPEITAAQVDSLQKMNDLRTTTLISSQAPDNRIPNWEVVKPKQSDNLAADESTYSAADSGDWYLRKRLGFGEIYAFRSWWAELPRGGDRRRSGNMDPISSDTVAHWRARAWAPRHGLQPDAANSEYSTFLIPGVGLAPVVEFEVLITLFVLIIGPLNYLLLRAYDRLHLMVLTTPLCALIASVGLFGYAVIADGFGAKARMRSVTLLDQASGEMANLGRVSLYAGITPSAGLSVPADTAIYPILPGWNEYSANEVRQPPKELVWTDDTQQLTSGWIPSRTTAQYYTCCARQTERKLRIVAAPDKVRVTNELGAEVEWLFVNDEANQTWIGPKLAVDASAQLKPIAKLDAVGQFRELCLAADPQFPAGYDSNMSVNNPRNRRGLRRQANGTWQPLDYSNIAAGNSLMEQYLDELSGLTGAEAINIPPRSYVAITSNPTEQPVPLKDAEQLSGFHVTVGRW